MAGRDPARLAEAERNRVLGVVPQVVQLFSGTVFDNLTLGDASVAEDAVYEAATIAGRRCLHPRRCPRATRRCSREAEAGLGPSCRPGSGSSLALARALVHRPAVVLLDEATAAIDNASDAAFRAALRERVLPRGATVVTVAHRLTTALDADRVIVLDKGRIVEEGAPADAHRRRGALRGAAGARGRRVGLARQRVGWPSFLPVVGEGTRRGRAPRRGWPETGWVWRAAHR